MTKVFKKGDKVTYISDWDRKGTTYYIHAIVYSAGKKQMILTDEITGKEIGRNFAPVLGDVTGTFHRMTDEQAVAKCLEAGAAIVAKQKVHFESRIEQNPHAGAGYFDAIRKDIAALHEPRAGSYQELRAAIRI